MGAHERAGPVGRAHPAPRLGAHSDPLEAPARSAAAGAPVAAASAAGHRATTALPTALRGLWTAAAAAPGHPLVPAERGPLEAGLGHDFSAVRLHTDPAAAALATSLSASALTVGEYVFLGREAATTTRSTTLAHELTHVVQQRAARKPPWIQRQPLGATQAPATATVHEGDQLGIEVYGIPGEAEPERIYSGRFTVGPGGVLTLGPAEAQARIQVAGLTAADAAQRIADGLVSAELYRGPRVCVTTPGARAPACADAKSAMSPQVRAAYSAFTAYLATTKEPAAAVARYYTWVSEHQNQPDFLTVKPWDLWSQCLKEPTRPPDPAAERTQTWLRFMQDKLAETKRLSGREQVLATETLRAFQDWYDAHKDTPAFATADPSQVYVSLWMKRLRVRIDADVAAKVAADKEAARTSPEAQAARERKFQEFLKRAMHLWGYSSRAYPYTIPVPSQGKDILVTGQPKLQRVLDDLGSALMTWVQHHYGDTNFATVSVDAVLVDLLDGGFAPRIAEAQLEPLEHETFDRNELLPGRVLAAFGETVAKGLLVVAVVGLFVGAEVITAGQATWILVGVAGYGGITSYQARREEIEKSGYTVPVPASMIHAAGDVVGVSQLAEGITGERLGTDRPLGSEGRSDQLGVGGGNVATLLVGSRAFKGGEVVGRTVKLNLPGKVPVGPDAGLVTPKSVTKPVPPRANPSPGPVEGAARAALPENLRPGLDLWLAEMRQNGADPEVTLKRLPSDKVAEQAKVFLERYQKAVEAADTAASQAARATDNPLNPRLRFVEEVGGGVRLRYESVQGRPSAAEIAQAKRLAARIGEPVELFGDTAGGQSYPGIDGTIGNPPRPMQLKSAGPQARPNLARKMASDALAAAQDLGYSLVEVYIEILGKTKAEVQAAWDAPPTVATDPIPGPAFDGTVVAKIVVQCSDGVWTLNPPLPKPLTGVAPPTQPERREPAPAK